MSLPEHHNGIVNCLGAPWPEDLSPVFIDQLREQGVILVGCTANLTWDDTLESVKNFETVKRPSAAIRMLTCYATLPI